MKVTKKISNADYQYNFFVSLVIHKNAPFFSPLTLSQFNP